MPSVGEIEYRENYDAILHLPIVQKLLKKNKELRRKVKTLETLLYQFPALFEGRERPAKKNIKTDATVEPTLCDTLVDEDVVFVQKTSEVVDLTEDSDEEVLDAKPNVFIKIEKDEALVVTKLAEVEEEEEEESEEEGVEAEAEEEVEEEVEVEEVEVEEAKPAAEEDTEVFEITIKGKSYYTNNETNGKIYSILEDEDVGPAVGQFVGGKAQFTKK